jgi:short-subunit dehydrogenase
VSYCTECPMPTLSVYTSTKAALKTLSDAMRYQLPTHIYSRFLLPGIIVHF